MSSYLFTILRRLIPESRVCRGALWDLLLRWGCDQSLLHVIQKLHGGTSYKVRAHGGFSSVFALECGLREGCPSSPVLFKIYHAAVMMDFRARRKEAASQGHMDEGIDWVAQVGGSLFRPRSFRKRGRCQLRTVLGDVEFADDTVLCSAASLLLLLNNCLMRLLMIGVRDAMSVRQSGSLWFLMHLTCR